MARIFISHSTCDGGDIAHALCAAIEQTGHCCWIAPRDVKAGAPFAGQLSGAIRNSSVLVLILTAAAAKSQHVLREVHLADRAGKAILSIVVDGAKPSDDLDYYLSLNHQIVWSGEQSATAELLRTLPVPDSEDRNVEVVSNDPAVDIDELRITHLATKAIEKELDAAMASLLNSEDSEEVREDEIVSVGGDQPEAEHPVDEVWSAEEGRAHGVLRSLGLRIVAEGPSRRYPKATPGPAIGYRYWATYLRDSNKILLGVQREDGRVPDLHLSRLLEAGYKQRTKPNEFFVEIDGEHPTLYLHRAKAVAAELRQLLAL